MYFVGIVCGGWILLDYEKFGGGDCVLVKIGEIVDSGGLIVIVDSKMLVCVGVVGGGVREN